MNSDRRVLLTGSEGFLGRAVAGQLGDAVVHCDTKIGKSISDVVQSDVLGDVDAVIHCAAVQLFTPGEALRKYDTFHQANVVVLKKLLEACVEKHVRKFIHISTDMVYGIPRRCPLPEDEELRPVGHYGRSKRHAEELVESAREKIPVVTILRPRVIGGPGRAGLFALLAKLSRKHLPIPMFGSGRNLYQMIHVKDMAAIIMEALERDVPGVYNVGSLEPSTLREKVTIAAECIGGSARFLPIPEWLAIAGCACLHRLHLGPLHPEQYLTTGRAFVLSMDRTLDNFSWRPQFTDSDIIRDSFRWISNNQ